MQSSRDKDGSAQMVIVLVGFFFVDAGGGVCLPRASDKEKAPSRRRIGSALDLS